MFKEGQPWIMDTKGPPTLAWILSYVIVCHTREDSEVIENAEEKKVLRGGGGGSAI
jgi:hypothetical protein